MDKFAVLEFEEYPDEWTRVRISGVSVRAFEEIVDAGNQAGSTLRPEHFRALCDVFAPFVDSWSYPETPDAAGLVERDMNLLLGFVRSWVTGVREAPLPLPRRPSATAPSESESP